MSPALSLLSSPRPSISAPPAHVLPQRTFSGRIRRFISPFPPPRLLPPAWSLARRPPSWPRFCVRSRLGKCVSLDWNSSGRLTKSKYFLVRNCPLPGDFVTFYRYSRISFFVPEYDAFVIGYPRNLGGFIARRTRLRSSTNGLLVAPPRERRLESLSPYPAGIGRG